MDTDFNARVTILGEHLESENHPLGILIRKFQLLFPSDYQVEIEELMKS